MSTSWWLFGVLLGMRHALEPDHLAAVSTLVVEQRRLTSGAILGGLWGVGHTLALLLVAALLGIAGAAMPPRLATVFELGVAVMLVIVGVRSMKGARRADWESHQPRPAAHPPNAHAHAHAQAQTHHHPVLSAARRRFRFARRSLVVGSIHGLAGSGALTALVASRLATTPGRLFYVALFGFGSVVGMTVLSGVAGWPLARLGRSPLLARALMAGTGVLAAGLGIVWGVPLVRALLS
ncbi:MAG: hypothetical protein ABI560_14640 [Myxococcales bacterium]